MEKKKTLYSVVLYCTVILIGLHCFLDPELYPKNCDLECKYYVRVFKKPQHCESHLPIQKESLFFGTYVLFIYFLFIHVFYLLCKCYCLDTRNSDHLLYCNVFGGEGTKIKFIENELNLHSLLAGRCMFPIW